MAGTYLLVEVREAQTLFRSVTCPYMLVLETGIQENSTEVNTSCAAGLCQRQ